MRVAILFACASAAFAAGSWANDVEKWRVDYETGLKAPSGWLSVAGLFWLHEGENSVGSAPGSDIVLPPGSPTRAGVLTLQNGAVVFHPPSAAARPLKPDSDDALSFNGASVTIIERGGKTAARLRDPNAPTRRDFTGCRWFPIDARWRVQAKWVAYPQPKKIAILNILGMTSEEPSPGYAEFDLKGSHLRLQPVIDEGQLFFMFKDKTSAESTYPAGRFLYAAIPSGATVDLDFNKAKNPPCAFTAYATCPLPPKTNTLPVAIEAGEKKYGRH
jgi:uncharacterized protein (DUF1684 family)